MITHTRARIALATALTIATTLAITAAPATALPQRTSDGPILASADANELAQTLADATSTQHVCYGWLVNVDDQSGGQSGVDAGSGENPNSSTPATNCKKYVVLHASIDYTCNSCSANDSATYSIVSNLPNPPSTADLDQLGEGASAVLANDNDTGLINSVGALPLIVAEKGDARAVPADLAPKPAGSPDHPTGSVSSGHSGVVIGGVVVLVFGLLWFAFELVRGRRRRPSAPSAQPS